MSWPITAAEVRSELKQGATSTMFDDAELAGFADSAMSKAEAVVGFRRGQVLRAVIRAWRTATEIVLPHSAGQVLGVTCGGVPVTDWEFDALPEQDRLIYVSGGIGPGRVVVDYRAPSSIWPDVEAACVQLAAHEAMQRKPGMGGAGDAGSPMGYAIPNRCAQVFEQHSETGGIS